MNLSFWLDMIKKLIGLYDESIVWPLPGFAIIMIGDFFRFWKVLKLCDGVNKQGANDTVLPQINPDYHC